MGNENLWAPWRMQYIRGIEPDRPMAAQQQAQGGEQAGDPMQAETGCFLCEAAAVAPGSDEARRRLLLLRDTRGMILLNRFPYTSGHLLVAPASHVADLPDMAPPARAHLMELMTLAEQVVGLAYAPQGFNIGLNLGRCAGAGLPGHLHVHVVPRWNGDTNFMAALGQIRVVPQSLDESWKQLNQALQAIEADHDSTPADQSPDKGDASLPPGS